MAIRTNGTDGVLQLASAVKTTFPLAIICYAGGASPKSDFMLGGMGGPAGLTVFQFLSNGITCRANTADSASAEKTGTWNTTGFNIFVIVYESLSSRKAYYNTATPAVDTATQTNGPSGYTTTKIGAWDTWGGGGALADIAEFHVCGAFSDADMTSLLGGAAPETLAGWVDGWALQNTSDLTSLGGTRTLTLVGGVTNSGLTHPVSRATAPTIGTQPTGQSVTEPAAATFTASVTGTYTGLRWQRQAAGAGGWSDIGGATSTTLTTGATSVTGGSWNSTDRVRLAVDWSGGVVYSTDVALTVSAGVVPVAFTGTVPAQSGTVGTAYSALALAGYFGGTQTPFTYAVFSGSLPPGLSLNTSTGQITGTPTTAGSYSAVIRATDSSSNVANTGTIAWTILAALATTFTFTIDGGLNLAGLKYAVFEHVTPDLWEVPIRKGANETSNGSGVCTVDVTGLTTRRVGELGSAFATNSDGTATGGAQSATRRAVYHVGAFS